MRQPKGHREHTVAPPEWRHTPCMTGDYELDGAIQQCPNTDMAARIADHLTGRNAYAPRTAYNGYDRYHGDD
jgi:hypothetical protein